MEIHGQLNVRVMLWYKSVSLLLLKLVRTVAIPLLQALKKKKSKPAVFKKSSICFLCEGFMSVFLSASSFSSLSTGTIWKDWPLIIGSSWGNIK